MWFLSRSESKRRFDEVPQGCFVDFVGLGQVGLWCAAEAEVCGESREQAGQPVGAVGRVAGRPQ